MLGPGGLIPGADATALVSECRRLHAEFLAGSWSVTTADEGVHSRLKPSSPNGWANLARSSIPAARADQVLTATRLWLKDSSSIAEGVAACAEALLERATTHQWMPLPGYTHLQRGMPSSCGQFFGAHAEALVDDLAWKGAANRRQLPAGFGASLALACLWIVKPSHVISASPPCIAMRDANSRGKVETAALDAVAPPGRP